MFNNGATFSLQSADNSPANTLNTGGSRDTTLTLESANNSPAEATASTITSSHSSPLNINTSHGKACALPPIDESKLISSDEVLLKYPKLVDEKKWTRLSVRLAQESFFGRKVMKCCTVMGTGDYHALPAKELKALKEAMIRVCVPRFIENRIKFETTWKACIESIGQSCKGLRN